MNFVNSDSTIVNKDPASDINYCIQYTRWFFRILGIWSQTNPNKSTKIERIVSIFVLTLCSITMMSLLIPMLARTISNRENREIFVVLGPMVFQISNVLKYCLMIFRSETINLCIQHMTTDWRKIENYKDRDIMMRKVRVGHHLTIICASCMYSSAIFYHVILPLCSDTLINEFNETVRPFTSPTTDIFVDVQTNITYEILYCINCLSAFFHYTVSTVVCTLAVTLVSHACGQIEIVISRLENLVGHPDEENNSSIIENRIAFIVQHHVRLLKFTTIIESVLSMICLMEVLVATFIICFLEYFCITEWNNNDRVAMITYIVLLASFVFNLFLYCQVGEVLQEQCQEVGRAAYMIEWYRLPGKTNLALVMIINMGNYPRKITAGGMMVLSKVSFASIMKTSFAYLNMLRSVV